MPVQVMAEIAAMRTSPRKSHGVRFVVLELATEVATPASLVAGAPQRWQKRAVARSAVAHRGQARGMSEVPHWGQNRPSAAAPHAGQVVGVEAGAESVMVSGS